ncbi:secreted RxLR effector protein 161-like [Silene latifolia]|uniref:secreted RxLR effector protein 161-like n=1 Tax=Silene latifolia TaxID=37657 RepID=UPI003D788542
MALLDVQHVCLRMFLRYLSYLLFGRTDKSKTSSIEVLILASYLNPFREETFQFSPPALVCSAFDRAIGRVSQEEYAKIIGSVMFLINCARPDIAYAISRLSRYTHNFNAEHWNALHCLLKYLKGTIDLSLHYGKFRAVLEGYCDANWVSRNDEMCSTSGYVFTLGGGVISWKYAKQTCIARSTMESEFIVIELAGQEADWLGATGCTSLLTL